MNLHNFGCLNPVTVAKRPESVGADMGPNLTRQNRERLRLNMRVRDKAREYDALSVCFQL
ncbi:hypothetical protein ALQ28_01010 [Pseudomonas syringae pv. delphinii]|uniref:Uncharacterized protein n=1 Tax=Pseudomonas syringae pv. delphinii TaxID=192088 RepID=A0A3M4BF06_9PSED|nr:hypothetical protein ALQ28_01010 [Pseudomonas syringae pv. delphinii]